MPRAIYENFYQDLKKKIISGTYEPLSFLPPEAVLTVEYACSRNTLRRAIDQLADEGYVQPLHGKGVRVIYIPGSKLSPEDNVNHIGSFDARAKAKAMVPKTEVRCFEHLLCDAELAKMSGFPEGAALVHVLRVRYMNGEAWQLDEDYLLEKSAIGLTEQHAEDSIYDYIERHNRIRIMSSQRALRIEPATALDEQELDLGRYNVVGVLEARTFNSDGIMFQFTQVHVHPEHFSYCAIARR